jgi:septal ring factor EnvC (AmiA/AmiB activator)
MMCLPSFSSLTSCYSRCSESTTLSAGSERINSWKNRVSPYCALVPSVLVLAICVMGLVMVLIYHNHYLTIPFAGGIAFSFYLVYLSYQSRLLDSLQKSVTHLGQQNAALTHNVTRFGTQLETQSKQIETHQKTNADQAAVMEAMKKEREWFLSFFAWFRTEMRGQVSDFRKLNVEGTEKQERLSAVVAIFDSEVEKLTKHREQQAKTSAEQRAALGKEIEEMRQIVLEQKAFRNALKALIDGQKAFNTTFEQLQVVQQQQSTLQHQLGASVATLNATNERVKQTEEALAQRTKELSKLDAALWEKVDQFNKANADHATHNQALGQIVVALSPLRATASPQGPHSGFTGTGTGSPLPFSIEGAVEGSPPVPATKTAVVS